MKGKKVSSIVLVIALTMVCSIGTCFAGTLPADSTNTVPVLMTINGDLAIDFTVSERITMVGNANSPDVNVSDLFITNNSSMGQIELKQLEVTTEEGWRILDKGVDFVNKAANSKIFSLTCGTHDFSDGKKVYEEDAFLIDSKKTELVSFDGQTCPTTEEIKGLKVANVIATIAIN